jgi:hypothetical protein
LNSWYVGNRHTGPAEDDPWAILGVAPGADAATLRAAYHALVKQYHPDRHLAEGVPAEFIRVTEARMAAINTAYARVTARGRAGPGAESWLPYTPNTRAPGKVARADSMPRVTTSRICCRAVGAGGGAHATPRPASPKSPVKKTNGAEEVMGDALRKPIADAHSAGGVAQFSSLAPYGPAASAGSGAMPHDAGMRAHVSCVSHQHDLSEPVT